MSNYTEQQYAESAAKYGIWPGPWYAHSGGDIWRRPQHELYEYGGPTAGDRPLAKALVGWSEDGRKGYQVHENAQAIAQLPNLLIERDALKAENERLRKALEWIVTDAAYKAPEQLADRDVTQRWVDVAEAALKGGGA